MITLTPKRKLKILDFDTENRPLSYWYSDVTTAEITALASCWVDDLSSLEVLVLGRDSILDILQAFVKRYNEADIVTGHYIRRHDLPLINGQLLENGMPALQPKMVSDTRTDLIKKHGLPATQEYLGEVIGLPAEKVHMTQHRWRKANRLTPEGIVATQSRVTGDVLQHMELREGMLKLGILKAPKIWYS